MIILENLNTEQKELYTQYYAHFKTKCPPILIDNVRLGNLCVSYGIKFNMNIEKAFEAATNHQSIQAENKLITDDLVFNT